MSSQLLLEFCHKKRDFPVINGLGLLLRGIVINLDPGLRSTMVVGKPLGYLPDRNSQRWVLQHFGSFTFIKLD
jgi:hypothetical protein